MCQPPPEEPECTPFYWLDYQGKNKLSPIVIEYSLIGEPGDNVTAAASCTYEEFRGLVPVSERCAKGAKLLDDDRVVPKDMIYQDENTNYTRIFQNSFFFKKIKFLFQNFAKISIFSKIRMNSHPSGNQFQATALSQNRGRTASKCALAQIATSKPKGFA